VWTHLIKSYQNGHLEVVNVLISLGVYMHKATNVAYIPFYLAYFEDFRVSEIFDIIRCRYE
jgi:hypothetical protein